MSQRRTCDLCGRRKYAVARTTFSQYTWLRYLCIGCVLMWLNNNYGLWEIVEVRPIGRER